MIGFSVITPPALEPVTVIELKELLRIDDSKQDGLLSAYISAAREYVEKRLGRALITQTLRMYRDHTFNTSFNPWYRPIQNITSIKTIDSEGSEAVYAASNYYLLNDVIYIKENAEQWREIRDRAGVQINYIAGYGDTAASVPAVIKEAIKALAALYYDSGGQCNAEDANRVCSMLHPYEVFFIGGW